MKKVKVNIDKLKLDKEKIVSLNYQATSLIKGGDTGPFLCGSAGTIVIGPHPNSAACSSGCPSQVNCSGFCTSESGSAF